MEGKVNDHVHEEQAIYVQEKLQLYKDTLEFIKSGDVLQEYLKMKEDMQSFEGEVISLRKELEELKKAFKDLKLKKTEQGDHKQSSVHFSQVTMPDSTPIKRLISGEGLGHSISPYMRKIKAKSVSKARIEK